MSTFDNENIDRLFDSLEEHSMDVEFDQFSDMEIRLEKMRYFRFGWKHFNIYYTGIIGATFVLSAIMFIDYLRREPVEQKVIVVSADSTHTEESAAVESIPAPAVVAKEKPKRKDQAAPLLVLPDTAVATIAAPPVATPPAPLKDTTVAPAPKAPKPKRVVVIPKRDTIIKYDTTKVIKRK